MSEAGRFWVFVGFGFPFAYSLTLEITAWGFPGFFGGAAVVNVLIERDWQTLMWFKKPTSEVEFASLHIGGLGFK